MDISELERYLCDHYPSLCPHFSVEFGDGVVSVPLDHLRRAATDLYNLGFDRLSMMTAVDRGDYFVLVYRIKARKLGVAMFLKSKVSRTEPVTDSFVDLWPALDWQEREVYDMFGIDFEGHPDLRRILLPEDWNGFPLRKDYADDRLVPRPDYF